MLRLLKIEGLRSGVISGGRSVSVIWSPLGLETSFRALKDFLILAAVDGLSSCFFVSLNPRVLRSSYRKFMYTDERVAVGLGELGAPKNLLMLVWEVVVFPESLFLDLFRVSLFCWLNCGISLFLMAPWVLLRSSLFVTSWDVPGLLLGGSSVPSLLKGASSPECSLPLSFGPPGVVSCVPVGMSVYSLGG